MNNNMVLFTGTANQKLSQKIARELRIPLGTMIVDRFSDTETKVEIEENIRGKEVFIVQSTNAPANHNIMQLLIIVDAIRRSAAESITAVIPYYGYSRQDRRPGFSRVPITSSLVANLLKTAGVDHVVTIDLHAQQIQGFFQMPIINATASGILTTDIERNYLSQNTIVVSPDIGGVARARALAKNIGKGDMDLAIIDKRRPEANVSEVMNIIGDVKGKTCITIDDIVDTAGTLCKAADALLDNGAKKVIAYCTHPVLSGNAIENLKNSRISELVVTDTIPLSKEAKRCGKIRVLSTATILAETIRRIHFKDSVSQLYSR
jgi:ribose-phosphate pyrophosphokinase